MWHGIEAVKAMLPMADAVTRAAEVLASEEFSQDVRQREQLYLSQGINSVPAVIINERYLVQGGQPVEMFEQALRQVAQQT